MRGNDERRSPAEGASTEAEVSAFEAVLIDPMQEKDEELKDRQFVTALARGLNCCAVSHHGKACWATRNWRRRPACRSRRCRV